MTNAVLEKKTERDQELRVLTKEVAGWLKEEGYQVLDVVLNDYNETIRLVIEKDGTKSFFLIQEVTYDIDSDGNRTNIDVFDIRFTPWYRNEKQKRMAV